MKSVLTQILVILTSLASLPDLAIGASVEAFAPPNNTTQQVDFSQMIRQECLINVVASDLLGSSFPTSIGDVTTSVFEDAVAMVFIMGYDIEPRVAQESALPGIVASLTKSTIKGLVHHPVLNLGPSAFQVDYLLGASYALRARIEDAEKVQQGLVGVIGILSSSTAILESCPLVSIALTTLTALSVADVPFRKNETSFLGELKITALLFGMASSVTETLKKVGLGLIPCPEGYLGMALFSDTPVLVPGFSEVLKTKAASMVLGGTVYQVSETPELSQREALRRSLARFVFVTVDTLVGVMITKIGNEAALSKDKLFYTRLAVLFTAHAAIYHGLGRVSERTVECVDQFVNDYILNPFVSSLP